ncbi:hypothetical protein [Kiloniella antarctica]|uniref:Na+-dependent transporter n=1 Tax=Kiloniella antarctica TaxID=1550907 RepID=A0ABW5BJY8_9PROT
MPLIINGIFFVLSKIGARASLILAISLPVGVILPEIVSKSLLPYLPHIIVGLITVAMIRVDLGRVILHLRKPIGLCASLVLLMVIIPFGMNWLAGFLALSLPLHMALVFMACAPPLGSAPNLAYLLKLDAELVFNVTIAGTLILPLIAPIMVGITLGNDIGFDSWALFSRLIVTVGASIFLAAFARNFFGQEGIKANEIALDGLSTLIMVLFVVAAMGGVTHILETNPMQVLYLLGIVLLANFGAQVGFSFFGMIIEKFCPEMSRRQSLSFGMVAGNRNLGLFAAAIPLTNLEQILPFLALYQVPIYLTPMIGGLFYRYFLNRTSIFKIAD